MKTEVTIAQGLEREAFSREIDRMVIANFSQRAEG